MTSIKLVTSQTIRPPSPSCPIGPDATAYDVPTCLSNSTTTVNSVIQNMNENREDYRNTNTNGKPEFDTYSWLK